MLDELQQNGTIGPTRLFPCKAGGNRMAQLVDASHETVGIETPGVSWGAILAGAAAACALTLLLLSLGVGLGFAVVSPWGSSGVSGAAAAFPRQASRSA